MPYELPSLANKPYRPSNGAEGRVFMAHFCQNCVREDREIEDYCPIATAALVFSEHEEGYPTEWRHDFRGRPECSAYKPLSFDEERRRAERPLPLAACEN